MTGFSLAPWGVVAAFYIQAGYAWWYFGEWPVSWSPDPADRASGLIFIDVVVTLLLAINIGGLVAWPAMMIFRWWNGARQHARLAAVFTCGWLVIIAQVLFDPGRLVYWWID